MAVDSESPLMGFNWNEAEANSSFSRFLLTIIAFDISGKPHAVGTGFIVGQGTKAAAVTASHVLAEIQRLQNPPPRHSLSALPEFLPPSKPIDLRGKFVHAIYQDETDVRVLAIDGCIYDVALDIAVFTVSPQEGDYRPFMPMVFELTDELPEINELVCILSYGDLKLDGFTKFSTDTSQFMVRRRPVMRVGRVLAHHLDGTRLCRGPCIETSIPVYSGMSGGPAMLFGRDGPIKVFGLICSDPDPDTIGKQNRKIEGRSILALLPCQIKMTKNGKRSTLLRLTASHSGYI